MLPLALGPHVSKFADIIKVLEPDPAAQDKGLYVEVNGDRCLLYVFTMAFTADMKQQMNNSGFGFPIGFRGCGTYFSATDTSETHAYSNNDSYLLRRLFIMRRSKYCTSESCRLRARLLGTFDSLLSNYPYYAFDLHLRKYFVC